MAIVNGKFALLTAPIETINNEQLLNQLYTDLNSIPAISYPARQQTILASTLTLSAANDGLNVNLSRAAGITVTLPAATGSGVYYNFITGVTVTSNANIINAVAATDTIYGTLFANNIGTGVIAWSGGADVDYLSFNGTTTGGIIGDFFRMQDTAAGIWTVTGGINQTGTGATPFNDT